MVPTSAASEYIDETWACYICVGKGQKDIKAGRIDRTGGDTT
jgi:hypothetical protein